MIENIMEKDRSIHDHFTELHHALDESLAYFIRETKKLPSTINVLELLEWLDKKKKDASYVG